MVNIDAQKEEQRRAIHEKLRTDLIYFAKNVLHIVDKSAELRPLEYNHAQMYLHEMLEKQLREQGMVRAIIVKGRQQGCSTYVTSRFYHKAIMNAHKKVVIAAHIATSTASIFEQVTLYKDQSPDQVTPTMEVENSKEMQFKNGSKYRVFTTGSGDIGRGQTTHLLHGSEVAFYTNIRNIKSGLLQSVADVPGSEIILESTANGIGDFFHRETQKALQGQSRYRVIFIPWYWQDEYRAQVPPDFKRTEEEEELVRLYGIDDEQLQWRRYKITDIDEALFHQEYPFTIEEAFIASGEQLIDAQFIAQARSSSTNDQTAPIIMGVDPARKNDRTVISIRQGRTFRDIRVLPEIDTMQLVGIIATMINERNVAMTFIDEGGLGYGVVDRLHELGFKQKVTGVNFGSSADNTELYLNKRAEMACSLRDWFKLGNVSIPDRDDVAMDLSSIPDYILTSNSKIKIESKDKIREVYGMSPDIFDAMALTFAYPVKPDIMNHRIANTSYPSSVGSVLTSMKSKQPNRSFNRKRKAPAPVIHSVTMRDLF